MIEQLQFTGAESYTNSAVKSKLALNHPCKYLAWVLQLDSNVSAGANRWADYTTSGTNSALFYKGADPMVNAKLQLNGQDRFSVRGAGYFNVVQPYQHFTRTPATGIYTYSFALNPEQHQPSGTVNMSRIDNAVLLLDLATGTSAIQLRVYAVNYNVLNLWDKKYNLKNYANLNILNNVQVTLINCGEILIFKTTTLKCNNFKGTRLISEFCISMQITNGNNVLTCIICSQFKLVQRLNISGEVIP
jgi:hypothetical protein